MYASRIVALLAILPAVAGVRAQGAAEQAADWAEAVARACNHPRYGMRLAVSKRIAQAGDDAVDAIRAHARDATLPLLLVDAIAQADTRGPKTLALLEEWARDRAFYWRSQALRGLADRALPQHAELFRGALTDPSHLQRIEGARGLFLLGVDKAPAHALLADPDPRARARIAAFLLEQRDRSGLAGAAHALRRRDVFLGDPWAQREAATVLRAYRVFADKPGIELEAASARLDAALSRGDFIPPPLPDDHAGGIEIRSCRNGDLFVRWTDGGRIDFGLDATARIELADATWAPLRADLPADPEDRTLGVVVCDYLRAVSREPTLALKCAPGELPEDLARWLKALAAALEKSGGGELAAELTSRLGQFERTRRE